MEKETSNTSKNNPSGNSQKLAYTEGWLSVGINILLFILKYWAGVVTGSVAIVADAWHTLSDSLSSIFVIIGARVSSKPPDKEHPFGHGRAELIASVLIAALLGFVAYEFVSEAITKLMNHEQVIFGNIAITVTIISIVFKEGLAQYAFWAARKTGSNSLRADGIHHRTDAISSALILVGIFIGNYFWWMDGVLGIIVALMILWSAYGILKDANSRLLGEAPDPKLKKKIEEIAKKVTSLNLNIHHIHVHDYVDHKELVFHILLPDDMSVIDSHQLTVKVEQQLKKELGMVATIHVEPVSSGG
jgi:cation diffusion facilitator family transporter